MHHTFRAVPSLNRNRFDAREAISDLRRIFAHRKDERELLKLRYELAAARFAAAGVGFALALRKSGFNPNQPRVPAGRSDGGRWTSDAEGTADPSDLPSAESASGTSDLPSTEDETVELSAAGNKKSPLWCWNQMQIDMLYCGSLIPAWRRAACRAQANERYAACITGKPVPPLPF